MSHRGQSAWHAYKGKVTEDGRSDCLPVRITGNTPPGRAKARLYGATVIAGMQRDELILQDKGYLRQGTTGVKKKDSGSQSLVIVPQVGGEVLSERPTVGKDEVRLMACSKDTLVLQQRGRENGNKIRANSTISGSKPKNGLYLDSTLAG
jgi:hypothetical protein